uniref:Uncharacterized protein n=1 Tax=Siphoviridae sp. ctj0M16 TaxID=2827918 RepID=A0A8S5S779_9CAUD|nr:MAG TPA: hypothetical protein [Siphoviridae sp. ctj0M16]
MLSGVIKMLKRIRAKLLINYLFIKTYFLGH